MAKKLSEKERLRRQRQREGSSGISFHVDGDGTVVKLSPKRMDGVKGYKVEELSKDKVL